MAERNQKKKRSKTPLALVALLLLGSLGVTWKLGVFGGEGGNADSENAGTDSGSVAIVESVEETEPIVETEGEGPLIYEIEVSGDKILWQNSEVTLDQLKENITNLSKTDKVTLIDNEAVQDSYQSVLDLLDENEISYGQK